MGIGRAVALVSALLLPSGATAQPVRAWQSTMVLPTYEEGAPDPNPPFDFFEESRFNYPYTLRHSLTGRRADRAWRTLELENEYLHCRVLPDLGGHLYGCRDKVNGVEMFYANPSIKLARIAYRGAWAAFGVEFNFPVSHNWMTTSPGDFAITRAGDGSASVWVGNIDRPYGMQWRVALTLRPGRSVLEQTTTLYNRSDQRHRFYWWTNAGVEVWDDSRILYPMAFTASHGFADIDTWPVDSSGTDLSVVGNHTRGWVSRFAHGSREGWMAVYHPRTRAGVVHYSSPLDLPAKKIWSWGRDPSGLDWRRALSDNDSAYVEIQAGVFRDQETYGFLEPQASLTFNEYWLPLRDLGGLSRANVDAAIHLAREPAGQDTEHLTVSLNVTRHLQGARLLLVDGDRALEAVNLGSASPRATITHRFGPLPAGRSYTVTLTDARDGEVISHTEGSYDFLDAREVRTGPQPPHKPSLDAGKGSDPSAETWLAVGTDQERDGKRLTALETYRSGLNAHPGSVGLLRAAGRLAVGLRQYDAAVAWLEPALASVSNDSESAYYLGRAYEALGQPGNARRAWEASQAYGTWRAASLLALAGLEARSGRLVAALEILRREPAGHGAVRLGALQVPLLRRLGRTAEARALVADWQGVDPTSSFLRVEAVRLGASDEALWRHLAADPERILEVAVDYMRLGLFDDALAVLARDYPAASLPTDPAPLVVTEPGMPHPSGYPLVAYYRGYCREKTGLDARPDFRAAAGQPVTYVFPNRPETRTVLERALEVDRRDAKARLLLGNLLLAGGEPERAIAEWEEARSLDGRLPTLHRNLGVTLMRVGGPTDRTIAILKDGMGVDRSNVGLYAALDRALEKAGRPAAERADAMLAYPDQSALPVDLVFRLAGTLAGAGRFDEAERQFHGRYFAREEGGVSVRQVWLEVRITRAEAAAGAGRCGEARAIVDTLSAPVDGLEFTNDGLEALLGHDPIRPRLESISSTCPRP